MNALVTTAALSSRPIALRTAGHSHGPITRLISPGDVGELVKPFVFLDLFKAPPDAFRGFPMHPHSGIATLTWVLGGSGVYEDTTGKSGVLPTGGMEWMQAGGGVWHTGHPIGEMPFEGFQLWVALPPKLENEPARSTYLSPEHIPQAGPVKVLLGEYQGLSSIVTPPSPMNYLAVELQDGEEWIYQPPAGHDVAWLAVARGTLEAAETIVQGELAVFADGNEPIHVRAKGIASFVVGSAAKHPYPLVLGNYSVHTSADALYRGEANIRRIGTELAARGKLSS
jgi:redox-sensitive bicupin YhaK (pirin superfamily)